ncbi:MAG: putative manganese-dependent inorganic diphosphatase [Lachnospiraceae bacterium]|nr:putative manganese-dependent inorganic diphosphatase [Lachnospiraceae bacterium]
MGLERKSVWVVGHKNPDTDAICAAITYANLKNKIDPTRAYIPKKAGKLSSETQYVLNRFGVEEPETVEDVGAQVKDIDYRETEGVDGHISLKKAWNIMKDHNVVTLPVVDKQKRLQGVIVNGDIAYSYMDVMDNTILGQAKTQYKNIIETIEGYMVTGNDHAYFTKGKVVVAAGDVNNMRIEIEDDDLVILENIRERLITALEQNASCIIVSTHDEVDDDIINMARDRECVLITTIHDIFGVARMVHQSLPIRYFMTDKDIISFEMDDYVDDVREQMSKIRHRDFPIIDEQRRLIGMMSRRNLLNYQKKKLILVDHNEKSQAVDGIEEANILEIIDHHRLGSLETISPIFFRNQPLGCTGTIIYQMYMEQGVEVDPQMAGLMLSEIISDTLMFRSPTCTEVDRMEAEKLAEIAGVDIEELATAMFEAGSDFASKTIDEIFYQDFKIFTMDDIQFGVSQVSAVSRKQLNSIKGELNEYMHTVLEEKGLNMAFVMLTDIFSESTELISLGGNSEQVIEKGFGAERVNDGYMLEGVVSRKKQLIPTLMLTIQE